MQNKMLELLDEYIRITQGLNDAMMDYDDDGNMNRKKLDFLISEKTRLVKRIEKVKQFVSKDELGEVGIKLEQIKKLDDKNYVAHMIKYHKKRLVV